MAVLIMEHAQTREISTSKNMTWTYFNILIKFLIVNKYTCNTSM